MNARALIIPAAISLAAFAAACQSKPAQNPQSTGKSDSKTSTSTSAGGESMEVLLCDGKTKVSVPTGTPVTSIAGSLMTEWLAKHPGSTWEAEERERQLVLATHEQRFASLLERKLTGRRDGEDLIVHRFTGWSRSGPEIDTRRILPSRDLARVLAVA